MKKITHINAAQLAIGIQSILLEMYKKQGIAKYPISEFERLIVAGKGVSTEDAERVTEAVINTGIIRWSLSDNCFAL